jgi:phosphohistidine phosphatase SixA
VADDEDRGCRLRFASLARCRAGAGAVGVAFEGADRDAARGRARHRAAPRRHQCRSSGPDPLHPENVAQQRQLDDKGRAEAKALGELLKEAKVPFGKVYASKFNRAVETARLIAGTEPEATFDVTEGGLVVSPNENSRRAKALQQLAAAAPTPGTNTLIVTHKPNILDAFGKDWFEVREGEASVFKPDAGGKATLVARVQMAQWAELVK